MTKISPPPNLNDKTEYLTTLPATDPISEALEEDKQLDEFESKYLSKRAGILHVTQFFYNPKDYIYERDEDGNLLPGFPKLKANAEPLLTLERVKEFVQKFDDTKEIAWVLHDKDTYTKSDEKNDDTGRKREGEPKPPHVHIFMRSKMKQTPSGTKSRQAIRLYNVSSCPPVSRLILSFLRLVNV